MSQKQQLQCVNDAVLAMIRAQKFNAFDGSKVAAALEKHRNLWDAVWWDMSGAEDPFLKVLDPVRGNTLYLRATKGLRKYDELDELVRSLDPSNVAHRAVDGRYVMGAWWD